jgi:hypothetical protein
MLTDKTVKRMLKKNSPLDVAKYLTRKHGYDLHDATEQINRLKQKEVSK